MAWVDFLARYFHILFGIVWIGLLYYFNFVQMLYMPQASDEGKKDVTQKLVPQALLYFRWAAMFTFITGLVLLGSFFHGDASGPINVSIVTGAVMGIIMMLNVWLVIWPNQKIVIAGGEGAAAAGAKAAVASRTNTLLSAPMLYFMVASKHMTQGGAFFSPIESQQPSIVALVLVFGLIAFFEFNAVVSRNMNLLGGKVLATHTAVIHASLALTFVMATIYRYA